MHTRFLRFPEGKIKCLTLSYDDGVEQDIKLIEIMQKYGLKGTFNINSGMYTDEGTIFKEGQIHRRMTKKRALELYKNSGMEIACHTLNHVFLDNMSSTQAVYEVLNDRINLERDFDTIIRGMAYPYGTYNDSVIKTLEQCGIVYSRTTFSTHEFKLPQNFLNLNPTCHHKDELLFDLADKFLNNTSDREPLLFYLWGHSYEFEKFNNWDIIIRFAKMMGNRDDIWYATNIEIYDYIKAYHSLIFTADGNTVFNPTVTDVFFYDYNLGKTFNVPAGQTVKLNLFY